jgi:membrane associated rhomboid family serine protease
MGTVVGASGAIYGIIVAFAFMFPNAELALLFIPVPIKAKFFAPGLVAVDLYLGVSGQSLSVAGIAHFAHVGGALFGFFSWYWKKISLKTTVGIKQKQVKHEYHRRHKITI